jgi:hypothetical protein
MGLTPRIWSHLAGVWQVRSVLRPPQTVYSLISTITAVPDRAPRAGGARGRRARAARAGGARGRRARAASTQRISTGAPRRRPRLSQMSGFTRSHS